MKQNRHAFSSQHFSLMSITFMFHLWRKISLKLCAQASLAGRHTFLSVVAAYLFLILLNFFHILLLQSSTPQFGISLSFMVLFLPVNSIPSPFLLLFFCLSSLLGDYAVLTFLSTNFFWGPFSLSDNWSISPTQLYPLGCRAERSQRCSQAGGQWMQHCPVASNPSSQPVVSILPCSLPAFLQQPPFSTTH